MGSKYYVEDIADGDRLVPASSVAMDRVVGFEFHTYPTAGTIAFSARPPGRADFIPIEGANAIPATQSGSITFGYPFAELKVTFSGITGDPKLMYLTIEDGVA
jgi:hypothetical protein